MKIGTASGSEVLDTTRNVSDSGPYATAEDIEIAAELGITVQRLRSERAQDDY